MNAERGRGRAEQSANLRLAEMEGRRRRTRKHTNHRRTVIDASSRFEIYHAGQVAVEASPGRLLSRA